MNVIVLYGAPAVGKLTIGRTLSHASGYPLLHNHLFFNIAIQLFPRFSSELESLYEELYLVALKHAASSGKEGVIITICAPDLESSRLIQKMSAAIESRQFAIYFVKLICDEKVLLQRVTSEDRREFDKLTDALQLETILKERDYSQPSAGPNSITINTSNLSVEDSVQSILKCFPF